MNKILLVNNDTGFIKELKSLLSTEPFQIVEAEDPNTAQTILAKKPVDLCILDLEIYSLAGIDPVQWCKICAKSTPLICLISETGRYSGGTGPVPSLQKPVEAVALVHLIKEKLSTSGFLGVLNNISLEDYIQLICAKKSAKAIRVNQQDQKGLILLKDGRVYYAAQNELKGIEAFEQIMSWKTGTFREVKIKLFPPPNINKDFRSLVSPGNGLVSAQVSQSNDVETAIKNDINTLAVPPSTSAPTHSSKQSAPTKQGGKTSQGTTVFGRPLVALGAIVGMIMLLVLLKPFSLLDNLPRHAAAISDKSQSMNASSPSLTSAPPLFSSIPGTTAPSAEPAEVRTHTDNNKPLVAPGPSKNLDKSQSISINPLISSEENEGIREEIILRLHGSNTVGAALAPALAEKYLADVLNAEKIWREKGNSPNELEIKARINETIEVIEIHAHGSSTGFKDMIAGLCDIAMASRKIKEKEHVALQKMGNMTAVTNEHVIALDGIAAIVNKGNGLNKLTIGQLADIFSGMTTRWESIANNTGEIAIYARDDNSGTYDTFKSIVLGKTHKLKSGVERFESNPKLSSTVSANPHAVGFTSLATIGNAKPLAIADSGASPIFPSFFTVATEDYPISRRLYMYTANHQDNKHVMPFIEFVHSPQGQGVVSDIGFVDMNVKAFYAKQPDLANVKNLQTVQAYLSATKEARRLSTNFRFDIGHSTLDNRGLRDLDRIVHFLKDKTAQRTILAGFADNAGDYGQNVRLAENRAKTVAEQLQARGIFVSDIVSCGEELPVASNSTRKGREKNRRVEIWVR